MNWFEHHKKHARNAFAVAVLTFLFGVGAGGYELGVNHKPFWQAGLAAAEFWLLSLILFVLAYQSNKKAVMKNGSTESTATDFCFLGQEFMVKQLGGLDLCYRYFTVSGNVFAEFREKKSLLNRIFTFLPHADSFLSRTFFVSDASGTCRLVLKQKTGLPPYIDVYLPSGERIARYRTNPFLFGLKVEDEKGSLIAETKGEGFNHRITLRDKNGSILLEFLNMGLPSRNQDYFTISDDLVRFHGNWREDHSLYLQLLAIPAMIKINYRK